MHTEEYLHIGLCIILGSYVREALHYRSRRGVSFRPNFYIDFLLNRRIYHGPLSVDLTRLDCIFFSLVQISLSNVTDGLRKEKGII